MKSPQIKLSGKQATIAFNKLYRCDWQRRPEAEQLAASSLLNRLTSPLRGVTLSLCQLSFNELEILRSVLRRMTIQRGPRAGPTRRSVRKKLAVLDEFLGRSAVDRLGDIVR